MNIAFRLRKVVRHVTATRSKVCCFRNCVKDEFFSCKTSRKSNKHVTVVWEKVVSFFIEHLSDRKLDSIMSSIWSMVRPTKSLLKIIWGTLINHTSKY